MSHIQWVARQNKLEIPRDKDEVNKRAIHECDGWAHDPDTMVTPLTPKPTRKTETLEVFYFRFFCLSWINKAKAKDKMYMSVGVMKDYKLKLRKLRV